MEPSGDAELRALRERAYGRDADILSDPAALRRLRALEADVRRVAVPDPIAASAAEPVAPPPQVVGPPSAAAGPPASASGEPAPARRRRRATPLLWAGSLILAAALGAVIAGTIGGPSLRGGPSGHDVRRVDVLTLGPGVEWPADFEAGWSVEAGTRFADITIVRMRQRGAASSECLMVSVPRAAGTVSTDERVYGGCRVGGFSARAEMVVDRAAPGALRDRFPVGTGLQFVLVGDRVEVYTDRP